MEDQRPPGIDPEDEQPDATESVPDEQPAAPADAEAPAPVVPEPLAPEPVSPESIAPDAQATQPIAYPVERAAAPMEPIDPPAGADDEQMRLLQRLTPTELEVLRLRCAGLTTERIGAHLGITQADAATHLANVMDKLGITYGQGGTSYSRLMAFCPAATQVVLPVVSSTRRASLPLDQPSQRAVDLTAADDAALLAQLGGAEAPPPDQGGRQGWIIGGVLAFILIIGFLALLLIDDDDQEEADATATAEQATEIAPTETPEPGETQQPEAPTATAVPEEPTATPEAPTATPEPEPTATEVPPTEEPEPTPTEEEPTATATEEPEPTPTDEPEPTPTEEEAEPTATEASGTPEPGEGDLAYEADWSAGDDGWALLPGWVIQDGVLSADGSEAAPLLSPFQPEGADYAVEIEMTVTDNTGCDELTGPFARVTEETTPGGDVLVGYAGNVCVSEWRIDAVGAEQRDTLEGSDFVLDDQPHVYRLEVVGERIRLFVDGEFIGEAEDDSWTDPGGAGIYLEGAAQISVSTFRVFALESEE